MEENEVCPTCQEPLYYGEQSVDFLDENSGEFYEVSLGAYWCSCCSYSRVVRA